MIHYNFNKSSILISPLAKSCKNILKSKETGLFGQNISTGLIANLSSTIFGYILKSI